MSPNESQLRAALRDGEGERVSADTVIARARGMHQARHDQRVRFASVAAAVAVVGGIGVTAGAFLNRTNNGTDAGSGTAKGAVRSSVTRAGLPAAGSDNQPAAVPAAPGPLRDAAAVPCPATAPHLAAPGGGSSGPSGAAGSLFSGPVESIKLCAYHEQDGTPLTDSTGKTVDTVLTGAQATQLAASLDAAPTTRTANRCPLYLTANGRTVVIIGLSESGQAMRPITATVAQNTCNKPVTNGTAVRYGWVPPVVLDKFVLRLRQIEGVPRGIDPSGKVTASPVTS